MGAHPSETHMSAHVCAHVCAALCIVPRLTHSLPSGTSHNIWEIRVCSGAKGQA